MHTLMYVHVYIYIYIYTHIHIRMDPNEQTNNYVHIYIERGEHSYQSVTSGI